MNSKLIAAFAVLAVTMAGICGVAMISEDSDAASSNVYKHIDNWDDFESTYGDKLGDPSQFDTLQSKYPNFKGTFVQLYVNEFPSLTTIGYCADGDLTLYNQLFTGLQVVGGQGNIFSVKALSDSSIITENVTANPTVIQGACFYGDTYYLTYIEVYQSVIEEDIDFTSPSSVEALSGASVSYTADTNIDATFSKSGGTASTLSVSSTGKVTGNLPTVTSVTDYTLAIKATSKTNSSNTVTQTITFTVYPILKISPSSSTTISGTEDEAITAVQLSANLDATFSKSSGTWPSGISMSSSGKISGMPTAASTASVTVKATAAEGPSQTATKTIKFDIEAAEASLTLTVGTPASSYIAGGSVSISVSANVSGTTFKITGDGSSFLTISGGKITGSIPTTYEEQTTISFKVTGTSPGGQTASKDLALTIEPKIEFTTVPTVSCVINPVYDYDEDGQPVLSSLIPSVLAADPESYIFPDTLTIEAVFTGENAETVTWDWGDGSEVSTGNKAQHTYAEAGTYTIVLTATNDVGSDTLEITVTVGESGFDYVYWIIIAVLAIVAIYLIYRLAAGPSRRRS